MTWDTSGTKDLVDLAGFCKDGIVFAALLGEFEYVRSVEWVGDVVVDVTILLVEGRRREWLWTCTAREFLMPSESSHLGSWCRDIRLSFDLGWQWELLALSW